MYSCLPHTVETVDAPFEFGFHSSRVINFVVRLVVSLLEADHSVQSVVRQFLVFFCFKRHYFNLQVAEVRLCQIQCTGNVRDTCSSRIFTRNKQKILEGCQSFDSFVFVDDFFLRQYGPFHRITDMETAVHTGIGT